MKMTELKRIVRETMKEDNLGERARWRNTKSDNQWIDDAPTEPNKKFRTGMLKRMAQQDKDPDHAAATRALSGKGRIDRGSSVSKSTIDKQKSDPLAHKVHVAEYHQRNANEEVTPPPERGETIQGKLARQNAEWEREKPIRSLGKKVARSKEDLRRAINAPVEESIATMPKLSALIRNEHLKMLVKTQEGQRGAVLETVNRVVKTEYQKMMKEAEDRAESINKKLEELRKTLLKEGQITNRDMGSGTVMKAALPERRIPIATVSELLDIPINELVLHFLNGHRIEENSIPSFEYRLGEVYFYDSSFTTAE